MPPVYTGFENRTDDELISLIDRSDNLLACEILRRAIANAEEIEDLQHAAKLLREELADAREAVGIEQLETRARLAENRATDFERKAQKLERRLNEVMEATARRDVEWSNKVTALEKRINDAPATW